MFPVPRPGRALTLGAATLTDAGFITGPTTTAATSFILPGTVTAGSAGVGVLTLGDMTLTAGTTINYGLDAGNPTANYIKAATVTLPGAGTIVVNLFTPGTASPFAAAGTYDLFQYTTLAGGPVSGAFSIGTSITGYTPSFTTSGGFVQLMLTAAGVVANWINGNGTANWSEAGNWSGGVPSSPGDVATFSSGTTPGTVNLDVNKTVGGVTFNNAASYTISGANTLTLDNSGAGAAIGVSAGTHTIQTAVALNDNLTVTPVAGAQLTISGNISQITGTRSLTVGGAGTLVLSGVNSYSGGTFVGNGVLNFNGLSALGSGTTLDLGATTNGTLRYASGNTADVSSLTVTLNAGGGTIDTNGNDVTLVNSIGNNGAGGLIKAGSGTLTLAGANSYTGATTIGAGKISVSSNANLGPQTTAAPLIFTGTGGKVATTTSFGLFNGAAGTNDRVIAINGANGTLAPASGTTLTVSGPITGTGKLIKEDGGQVTIQNATALQNTYSGGTLVSAGTIALADANANAQGLGTGTVTFEGGTVKLFSNPVLATDAGNFANNLVVNTGQTGTLIAMARGTIGGSLTGNGTLNYQTDYVRAQLNGNWSAFTGQINVTPNTNGGDFRLITTAGFGTARINLANGVTMYMQTNFGAGGLTNSIGELTGGATSFLRGGPTAGRVMTWSVGGAGMNAQFDGSIQDGTGSTAITKAGAGSWTLTHANTYTGVTAVSAGILNIQNSTALGDVAGATTVSNGATLQLQGGISVGAEALTLNGGAAIGQTGALVNVSGTNTYGGAITMAASSSISALIGSTLNLTGGVVKNGTTATFTGGGTINVNGVGISGSSPNSDLVVDGVTLTEGVANTYNGPTSITNAGILNANVAGALPAATRTALSMDQTGSGSSTLALGASQSAASLTGAASSIVNLGANTLTIGAASGTHTFAGVISGTGGTLIKDDNSTQILSGPNTYDGGTTLSGGTLTAGNNSGFGSGAVTLNGAKLASNNDSRSLSNALAVNNFAGNQITGSNSLTLTGNASGAGMLQVNFTDTTKTLTVNPASANGFAPATLDVTGGTLLLGGSDKVGNSTALILSGGTFNTGGFSEGDVNTDGLGSLTLSANSTLDFGAGTGSQLWFSGFSSHTASTTLSILGWNGTESQAGGPTDDRLIFVGTSSSFTNVFNQSEVSFNGNLGYTAIQFDIGHYEVVPVPEPSSIATVMGLLGLVGWRERRKTRQARSAERRVCVS